MSYDPRKVWTVKSCPPSNIKMQAEQEKKKGFLESITKIGDLEILNDVGFGKVGQGLRVLASVSNSVRTNSAIGSAVGGILNTVSDTVDAGATSVMDTLGLTDAYNAAKDFRPDVANRAYGQAKSIYEKIKQGEFELSDIPDVFQDFQNLEALARGIFPTSSHNEKPQEICDASPYAMDLIAYAPKFKFMFVLDIKFSPAYASDWQDIASSTAFVVKRSTRPGLDIEYEDVNMYNFHTKVPRKIAYPPITMSFYDDNKNAAHLFYTAYMRAMSPIANMKNKQPQTSLYEINSMNFNRDPDTATFDANSPSIKGYAASLGTLLDDSKSLISEIRLFHIFDYGRLVNIYNFYNPRIMSFTPSELDMSESGSGADFEFQFAYDGLFIDPGYDLKEYNDEIDMETLTSNRHTAKYAIKPVFESFYTEHSQQSLAPAAQIQQSRDFANAETDAEFAAIDAEFAALPDSNPLGKTVVSDGSGKDTFSSGITGAINDGIASAKSTVSNAFKAGSDYIGSVFK